MSRTCECVYASSGYPDPNCYNCGGTGEVDGNAIEGFICLFLFAVGLGLVMALGYVMLLSVSYAFRYFQ